MQNKTATLLATWFGAGLFPKAPGTMGSLAALPFAWVIMEYSGRAGLLAATILVFFIGLWATKIYLAETGKTDPGEVVIDEVVGQWLVCLLISNNYDMGQYILALLAFRVFDVMKPWPVSVVDQRHDAMGVMGDDVVAGIMGAVTLWGVNTYVL